MTVLAVETDSLADALRAERDGYVAMARRAHKQASDTSGNPSVAARHLDVARGALVAAGALQRDLNLLREIDEEGRDR